MKLLLIGAGPMALEYCKVLTELNVDFDVIGRGGNSAKNFTKQSGIECQTGGFSSEHDYNQYDYAIIAVTENMLGEVCRQAISSGIKNILVEKPGGLTIEDIRHVAEVATKKSVGVFVAYNRRFYASTIEAQKRIELDGGLKSFEFEFTEWGHVIEPLVKEEGVKENWFLANSSHVVDLAFYLGGVPTDFSSYTSGELSWHRKASVFAGAGISSLGALFTYKANWSAPGRWGVELLTNKHRYIMRPLEKLFVQDIGSIEVREVPIEDDDDMKFKPGLLKQVKSFLENPEQLLTIHDQEQALSFYSKMLGE